VWLSGHCASFSDLLKKEYEFTGKSNACVSHLARLMMRPMFAWPTAALLSRSTLAWIAATTCCRIVKPAFIPILQTVGVRTETQQQKEQRTQEIL
jgi:hypothetical protein